LVVVAGFTPFKDISIEEAKKQIVGYSVGNDFSPRPGPKLGQMNYIWSKSFDEFTPVGPILVNAEVLGIPPSLELTTRVSGRVVQNDNTKNMTHDVAKIVSALSIGMSTTFWARVVRMCKTDSLKELLFNLVPLSSQAPVEVGNGLSMEGSLAVSPAVLRLRSRLTKLERL
jgi:hypothetical protein